MLTAVDCPSCGRKLRLTEEVLGKEVKCPSCDQSFVAPAPEKAAPAADVTVLAPLRPNELECAPPAIPGLPPPPKPFRAVLVGTEEGPAVEEPEEKEDRCPFCRSRVREGALCCPVCETDLRAPRGRRRPEPEEEELPPRRDYEPHRGSLISTLGTISILLGVPGLCGALVLPFTLASLLGAGLGIAAVSMARADLDSMDRNLIDPDGRRSTVTGQGNGFVGMVLGLIGVVLGVLSGLLRFFGDW